MKEIFIKYNPYQLVTEITIDGQKLKKNSKLNFEDRRLQEWVESLPDLFSTKTDICLISFIAFTSLLIVKFTVIYNSLCLTLTSCDGFRLNKRYLCAKSQRTA